MSATRSNARVVINPMRRTNVPVLDPAVADGLAPLAFHQRLAGYLPSPLLATPELAQALGVGALWVKDESSRLGLPAFKILGASWATYRALDQHVGGFAPWKTFDDLAAQLRSHLPLTLAAATDGNHGRAVARMARLLGLQARIYLPAGSAAARVEAIRSEGATATVIDGSYDDAVALAAEQISERCLVIADVAWPNYEQVPVWTSEGYMTIMSEIDESLGGATPDLVLVPIGVGGLAAAVVSHYRAASRTDQPTIVGVEPTAADCMLRSIEAGKPVSIPGPHDSIMAGLNCGEPSPTAWPIVAAGTDAFIAIDDERAREAMRLLARVELVAGETGAAALGGLVELLQPEHAGLRRQLGIAADARVLVIMTEGATDPAAYAEIVGEGV
jgi:diaminopropionate ammonia-lyase